MRNGRPRKNKSDIYQALLNSKVAVKDVKEYEGGNPALYRPLFCSFCCIFPIILATILSITTGSSAILNLIEGMSTIIPPTEMSIQITILTDGSILFPNGTLHRDELVLAKTSSTLGFKRPRGFKLSVDD